MQAVPSGTATALSPEAAWGSASVFFPVSSSTTRRTVLDVRWERPTFCNRDSMWEEEAWHNGSGDPEKEEKEDGPLRSWTVEGVSEFSATLARLKSSNTEDEDKEEEEGFSSFSGDNADFSHFTNAS